MVSESPESIKMKVAPSEEIAKSLLEIGAVKFNVENPFTWVSQIKSPIYCDNRIINSKVPVRDAVIDEFVRIITDYYKGKVDVIAAIATGGIPYGALVADRLRLPLIYVREKRKEHGLKKLIEGYYEPGQRVILIEDHISMGVSSLKAVEALREEDLELIALLSIMTYGFKSTKDKFKYYEIESRSICDLDSILHVASKQGLLNSSEVSEVLKFAQDPQKWSE